MLEAPCMNDHIFFFTSYNKGLLWWKKEVLKKGSVIVFQALRKFRVESRNTGIGTTNINQTFFSSPTFHSVWIIRFFEKIASFGINFKNKKIVTDLLVYRSNWRSFLWFGVIIVNAMPVLSRTLKTAAINIVIDKVVTKSKYWALDAVFCIWYCILNPQAFCVLDE